MTNQRRDGSTLSTRIKRAVQLALVLTIASGCAAHAAPLKLPSSDSSVPPKALPAEQIAPTASKSDEGVAVESAAAPAGEPTAGEPPATLIRAIAEGKLGLAAIELEARLNHPERFEARQLAEFRLARALVALEQGDPEAALAFGLDLEQQLPEFEPELESLRNDARRLLKRRPSRKIASSGLLDRARQQARAGEVVPAWISVTSAINVARSGAERAAARAFRAELADVRGLSHVARSDRRWLALHEPLSDEACGVDDVLAASGAPLSARDRYVRAQRFSELGDVARTEAEINAGQVAPGGGVSKAEWLFTQGWSYYRTRLRFSEAASLFESAARAPGGGSTRALYYAGRAWTRASEFQRALDIYEEMLGFVRGSFRERAQFQRARALSFAGRWSDAVAAYRDYLKINPHGESATTATRELGVALYAAGSFETAAAQFSAWGKRDPKSQDWAQLLRATSLRRAGHDQVADTVLEALSNPGSGELTALLASVRLRASAVDGPAESRARLISTPAFTAPVQMRLPTAVAWLRAWGFELQATQAVARRAKSLRESQGDWGAVCDAYSAIDEPARAYSIGYGELRRLRFESPEPETLWAWRCAYPRPWPAQVGSLSARWRVPSHLVYAVMRQESGFRPQVVSPVGAVGLMQVMPTTAVEISTLLGETPAPERLTESDYNLGLGTYYIGHLLKHFRGRPDLAVAAYNAGPQAVDMWAIAGAELPMELFWARIPFSETRHYVRRVLENWYRFELLYADEDRRNELVLALASNRDASEPTSVD